MKKVVLNKTLFSIYVNILLINAIVWIIGYTTNEYLALRNVLLELEKVQYHWSLTLLTLAGIVFIVQSTLLYIGKRHHIIIPVVGILFAFGYYVIHLISFFMSNISLSLDFFIIFGEFALFWLLSVRLIFLMINRF